MSKYEVGIIYRGLSNFIVEADNKEHARELARAAFINGEPPVIMGNEFERIENVSDVCSLEKDEIV